MCLFIQREATSSPAPQELDRQDPMPTLAPIHQESSLAL
jgi:hypothetical protein